MDSRIGKRLFALVLVVALSASALLAIGILLLGDFDETQARILVTTGLIGLFSLLALPGGVLLDQGRYAALAWTLIALAVFSLVVAMTLAWGDAETENLWRVAGSAAAVTGGLSQAATSTSRRRATDALAVRILYLLSLAAVALLALLVVSPSGTASNAKASTASSAPSQSSTCCSSCCNRSPADWAGPQLPHRPRRRGKPPTGLRSR